MQLCKYCRFPLLYIKFFFFIQSKWMPYSQQAKTVHSSHCYIGFTNYEKLSFQSTFKTVYLWDFYWVGAEEKTHQRKNEKKEKENIFPWNLIQRFVSREKNSAKFFFVFISLFLVVSSFLHLIKIFLNKKCFHFKFLDFFPYNRTHTNTFLMKL